MRNPYLPWVGFAIAFLIIVIAGVKGSINVYGIYGLAVAALFTGLFTGNYVKKVQSKWVTIQFETLPKMPHEKPKTSPNEKAADWTLKRTEEYVRVDGYMLAHVYRPSKVAGQSFDVFVFLVRHEKDSEEPPRKHFKEIEKVEFFFGDSWGNQVFTVTNTGGLIGVRTDAWGTFLATCQITFRASKTKPVVLYRYIDFHMLQDRPEDSQHWAMQHEYSRYEAEAEAPSRRP